MSRIRSSFAKLLETSSPEWLKRIPWAVWLYENIILPKSPRSDRQGIYRRYAGRACVKAVERPVSSDRVLVSIGSCSIAKLLPNDLGFDFHELNVLDFNENTIFYDLKMSVLRELILIEGAYRDGLSKVIVLDETKEYASPLRSFLVELGYKILPRANLFLNIECQIDSFLALKCRNITYLLGLPLTQKVAWIRVCSSISNRPELLQRVGSIVRYSKKFAYPVVFVGRSSFSEEEFTSISKSGLVSIIDDEFFSETEMRRMFSSKDMGSLEEVELDLLESGLCCFSNPGGVVDSRGLGEFLETEGAFEHGLTAAVTLERAELHNNKMDALKSGKIESVAFANRLDTRVVVNGVQRFVLSALGSSERTFGGGPYNSSSNFNGSDVFLRWGTSTSKTRREFDLNAHLSGRPAYQIEDGFIRSVSVGALGSPGLSFLLDSHSAYYDATTPSEIEQLLNSSWKPTLAEEELADKFISIMHKNRLSKYNHARDIIFDWSASKLRKVLIVDQRVGDASISSGFASAESFSRMLNVALVDSSFGKIIIKRHPDATIAGHEAHYSDKALSTLQSNPRIVVLDEEVNPYSLFDSVEEIFVVTSGMGFEAALYGKPVRTFGVPYYSNWGFTKDEIQLARRSSHRNVRDVFIAAWLRNSLYVDPVTGNKVEPLEFIHNFSSSVNEYRNHGQ